MRVKVRRCEGSSGGSSVWQRTGWLSVNRSEDGRGALRNFSISEWAECDDGRQKLMNS